MTSPSLVVLAVAGVPLPAESAELAIERAPSIVEALAVLADGPGVDVVVAASDDLAAAADADELLGADAALVVVAACADDPHEQAWLRRGAEDVLASDELRTPGGARRLRFAALRRRHARGSAHAHSTDLATGLPHRQQLVEHLSQLLALRQREPSPMAIVALRLDFALDGDDGALRRKAAVRLRAGVRSSDIVAAVDEAAFAVLLGSVVSADDAERVAAKLAAALLAPFSVDGVDRLGRVACGVAHYPQDGDDAERLLRRALALAAAAPTSFGSAAPAFEAAVHARDAANDPSAPSR